MPRRRQPRSDCQVEEILSGFGALILLIVFFVPGAREVFVSLGVIVAIIGIGLLAYRMFSDNRRQAERLKIKTFNLNQIEPDVTISPPAGTSPLPIADKPLCTATSDIDQQAANPHHPTTFSPGCAISTGTSLKDSGHRLPQTRLHRHSQRRRQSRRWRRPLITKDNITTAVQCKQWRTWQVGVKTIREFLGTLTDAGLQNGIFVTLQGYTGDARALADEHGIQIVNDTALAALLEKTDARFDPETLELLNDERKYCPKCERQMVLKTARKGKNIGKDFWACPGYPNHCSYILRC